MPGSPDAPVPPPAISQPTTVEGSTPSVPGVAKPKNLFELFGYGQKSAGVPEPAPQQQPTAFQEQFSTALDTAKRDLGVAPVSPMVPTNDYGRELFGVIIGKEPPSSEYMEQMRKIFGRTEQVLAKLSPEERKDLASGVTQAIKNLNGVTDTVQLEPKERLTAQQLSDWLMAKMV